MLLQALKLFLIMTIVTGIFYPLSVTLVAQTAFAHKSGGSLVSDGGKILGSELIAQKFTQDKYFWSRPSSIDYNPMPSGGSNLGPTSADLVKQVADRKAKLGDAPADMLMASGSGLDPHISPAAAKMQISRVARARGANESKVASIVETYTESPQWGIFGEKRVNVLLVNLALDKALEVNRK